tara:strand:- start:655 stop:1035 length:381 start_codon:yes stop_codon:yes gene_type:complete
MKPFILLVLPITALLGSASVESANAHTTRKADNGGTEVITEVNPPLVTVINSLEGKDSKITVDCSTGITSIETSYSGIAGTVKWIPEMLPTPTGKEEIHWTATTSWGTKFHVPDTPSFIVFACHTH